MVMLMCQVGCVCVVLAMHGFLVLAVLNTGSKLPLTTCFRWSW